MVTLLMLVTTVVLTSGGHQRDEAACQTTQRLVTAGQPVSAGPSQRYVAGQSKDFFLVVVGTKVWCTI